MSEINLEDLKERIANLVKKWLKVFLSLPTKDRPINEFNPEFQVVVRELGTQNIIFFTIEPSGDVQFFNTNTALLAIADEKRLPDGQIDMPELPPGNAVAVINGIELESIVIGLFPDENTFLAVMILANIAGDSPLQMCDYLSEKGIKLPDSFWGIDNYLHKFINSLRPTDSLPHF